MFNFLYGFFGAIICLCLFYWLDVPRMIKNILIPFQVRKLERFWEKYDYESEYTLFKESVVKNKIDYLTNHLTNSCLECKLLIEKMSKNVLKLNRRATKCLCCINGQCPAIDLRPWEKEFVLKNVVKTPDSNVLNIFGKDVKIKASQIISSYDKKIQEQDALITKISDEEKRNNDGIITRKSGVIQYKEE